MHDVPRPEAPVIILLTRSDYETATRRIRELENADPRNWTYLELLALRAAVTRWENENLVSSASRG